MRIATPSPSSNKAVNKCSIVISPLLFSLLSILAVSIIRFNKGVYKNHSLAFVPIHIISIISYFNF